MGAKESSHCRTFENTPVRAKDQIGATCVTGRYHRLPRRLQDDYAIDTKQVLGRGMNGKIHPAYGTDNHVYAVKELSLVGAKPADSIHLQQEVEIFLGVDHPNISRLVDVYDSQEKLSLVMEYLAGGTVLERLEAARRFSEREAMNVVWQMLLAVNYLHAKRIVHRDLKLNNFLYEQLFGSTVKLIDFGFSRKCQPGTRMTTSCGTLSYMAPEVLRGSYTSQCDMWSLGVISYMLMIGEMPFGGSKHEVSAIIKGSYKIKKEFTRVLTGSALAFVKQLLLLDPEERLTSEQALGHRWFRQRQSTSTHVKQKDLALVLSKFSQASRFRRKCMQFSARTRQGPEKQEVLEAFWQLDADHDGVISQKEFLDGLQGQFDSEEAAVEVFDALDLSGAGEICYSNFEAAHLNILGNNEGVHQVFQRFDCDSSGLITKDNVREVLGDSFAAADVDPIMEEFDVPGNVGINYNKWITHLQLQTDLVSIRESEPVACPVAATQAVQSRKAWRRAPQRQLQSLQSFLLDESISKS